MPAAPPVQEAGAGLLFCPVRPVPTWLVLVCIGRPSSFWVFLKMSWKNPNELFSHPNTVFTRPSLRSPSPSARPPPASQVGALNSKGESQQYSSTCPEWPLEPHRRHLVPLLRDSPSLLLSASHIPHLLWASQVVLLVKNMPANAGRHGNLGLNPGLARSPGGEHGNALGIAGRSHRTGEPAGLSSCVSRVRNS